MRNAISKIFTAMCVVFIAANIGVPAYAHGGGLDSYGCHNNRKEGNYHCHRGQFAGRTFASQAEMLKELAASKSK